ncbi:hypothetical protein [Tropicimonas sp. IMCC34043]|uniref:hypothetical protein n=1 Tax=Tropicimonas sp. IMCC34043 TaxID=2248760 RepID=UPI000E258A0F|nr:hypothetical protein [Tropicimonas sp. IMCC34043]
MMMYAPSTGGFYKREVHGKNIPSDAVDIEDAAYRGLLAGIAQGQRIVAGAGGVPVLEDPVVDPYDERLARWRTTAELSSVQLRLALRACADIAEMAPLAAAFPEAGNLLDLVQRHVATLPADDPAAVIWEYATRFVRGDEDTATLFSAATGVDDPWIDDLYDGVLGTMPAA